MSNTDEETIRVRFNGRDFFWLKDADNTGPLAPLDHCDRAGNLHLMSAFENSYAHVCSDGRILRYGEKIGTVDDLERQP